MSGGFQPVAPEFLAEIRRRTSLAELIGPDIDKWRSAGKGEFKGLCPFHSERTPSFYVIEPKGFWHCFGCGAHGDAIAWVRQTTTARNFLEAVEYLAARAGLAQTGPKLDPKPIVPRPSDDLLAERQAKKIEGARDIWARHQVATEYTPVGRYLRDIRRIRLAPVPPTIGYIPQLDHPYLRRGVGFPAMVAPIQAVDRRIVGVHCTYLASDGGGKMTAPPGWPAGEAWKAKIMRGVARHGAIRLTPAEDLMVVAEGVETALSVLQALYDEEVGAPHIDGEPVGVWAAGSLDNMGAIALPAGVREVILAADGDGKIPDAAEPERKDPEELIQAAAAKHRDEGRNVRIARPPAGADFNDLLPPGAGASAGDDDDGAAGTFGEAA